MKGKVKTEGDKRADEGQSKVWMCREYKRDVEEEKEVVERREGGGE